LNPKYAKVFSRLAKSHVALGAYENALIWYEKAMEAAPTDSGIIGEAGVCQAVNLLGKNL